MTSTQCYTAMQVGRPSWSALSVGDTRFTGVLTELNTSVTVREKIAPASESAHTERSNFFSPAIENGRYCSSVTFDGDELSNYGRTINVPPDTLPEVLRGGAEAF